MITDEQILEIASQHLYCNISVVEWSGKSEDILNFARAIHQMGYDEGYDEGWESSAVSEYMNSGLVGDPQ